MNSSEEQKGTGVPPAGTTPAGTGSPHTPPDSTPQPAEPVDTYDDGYPHEPPLEEPVVAVKPEPPPSTTAVATVPRRPSGGGKKPPTPPPPSGNGDDDDDDGMLRMSFLQHLEELRSRIIRALLGVAVAFGACVFFMDQLWRIVAAPAVSALKALKYDPELVQISPMEAFNIIWVKLPILC